MLKHLLVPLDGSSMAESAVPIAAAIASRVGASLTLVHVIEKNAPSEVHSERHLVTAEEARAYLDSVAGRPPLKGMTVETHVHAAEVRDVSRSITEHTAELAPDLVVMTTHGTGGARRLFSGAIAQQVVAAGRTPVLLVRPEGVKTPAGAWRLILVPIDGDPAHQKSMPLAADLALAFACRLHLLMVTHTSGTLSGTEHAAGTLMPGATRIKLEMDSAAAAAYLDTCAADLAKRGVKAECEATRGDPAKAIIRAARRLSPDLLVMATHGRAGTNAFYEGSVAARVIVRARAPLLLMPLKE